MQTKRNKVKPLPSKRAARQSARRRQGLLTRILFGILALGAIVAIFFLLNDGGNSNQQIDGVVAHPGLAREHVNSPVVYDQTPPAGGAHSPAWQNCGVYLETIANENGVHSLEHGAVWITYSQDLSVTEIEALQTLTRQSGFRLLSPYPDLPSPIVVSAWGYQLQLEQADDPRLGAFIEQYELNPQGPEPGAPCTGGLGQPG